MAKRLNVIVGCEESGVVREAFRALGHNARGVPKYDQSIQPWQFGHEEFKRTCLWLRGLPLLHPTDDLRVLDLPQPGSADHKRWSQVHRAGPSATRARDRSVTYAGLAYAMAWQWGGDARGED